jgi:hypothetical protein
MNIKKQIQMENVIEFKKCVTDFEKLESSDCENGIKITVFSDVQDLLIYNNRKEQMDDGTVFGLWVVCGEKTLMMDVSINELELFTSSVLKQIEIIRKSYGEQIKKQSDMGCVV